MADLSTDLATSIATNLATDVAGVDVPIALDAAEWWDASTGVTVDTGASAWLGRAAGLTWAQATTAQQPALDLNYSAWSAPALVFDGSDDGMTFSGTLASATDYTVAIVLDQTVLQNAFALDVQTGRLIFTPHHDSVGLGANAVGSFDGTGWMGASAQATTGAQYLVWTGENGVGRTARKNGAEIATGTYTQRALDGTWGLGRAYSGGTLFAGAISDVVVFTRALSAADLSTLETWLAGRAGL